MAKLSKTALKLLISNIGLKRKYRDVLLYKYVEEKTNYEIGLIMGYTSESVANLLVKARRSFQDIMKREQLIHDRELQLYIDLLNRP